MTDSNLAFRFEIKSLEDASDSKRAKKHYSLDKLLEGITPENVRALVKETAWAREGILVGEEIL